MASYVAVPCPKLPSLLLNSASLGVPMVSQARVSLQGCKEKKFFALSAKTSEAIVEGSPNSLPRETAKPSPEDEDVVAEEGSNLQTAVSDSEISAFMLEVSNLVKLVDSRDITELRLKRKDCELIIRKKEALELPPPAAPVVMMQPPQGMFPTQSYVSHSAPAPSSPSPLAPTPAPPPKGTNTSLPALKSPMAGTFYRSPGPGEPPFVKAGDKVKKGQVVCIIEAMKLMNEIEADQSGTVVEVVAEDGKPVSIDTPLLIIGP